MLHAVEKFGQIHIDTMSVSRADVSLDLLDCSVGRAFGSKTET